MRKILLIFAAIASFMSCSSSDDNSINENNNIQPLGNLENVSLNHHASTQTIRLARNVESEGATITTKDKVGWISALSLKGNTITFNVSENTDIETGHRFDTILVNIRNKRIGAICVSQARIPISSTRLVWAVSNALYRDIPLIKSNLSGKEITQAIYNLSKTTGGRDSYKNYPAFAYCIEMNHDPEHNMEWHLPSLNEMNAYANGQSFDYTPFDKHNYWWSATENDLNGYAFSLYSGSIASRGAESKGHDWWVMAFRNGKMEE